MILQDSQAVAFGKVRGWKLAERGVYGWREIAGPPFTVNIRRHFAVRSELPPYSDHTWFYRTDRKPVAIVSFPYHAETLDVAMELTLFASEHGLKVEIDPPDLHNWYGHETTMIVWTKAP